MAVCSLGTARNSYSPPSARRLYESVCAML